MAKLREDFESQIKKLENKFDGALRNKNKDTDMSLNIVIVGLPETENENTVDKTNCLIKKELKIEDIEMEKVSRRKSKIQGKPGVIIAKCKSSPDKEII